MGNSRGGGLEVTGLNAFVRDLKGLGLEVEDLKDVFQSIATLGADLARAFAPKRSGRLAGSIRPNRSQNKAVISAGYAARVPYAGAINYGWGRLGSGYKHGNYALGGLRGTYPGALFMQKADDALRPIALQELETGITRLIKEKGLT